VLPRFRRGAFAVFVLAFAVSMLLGDRAGFAPALTVTPDLVLQGQRWWTPLTALLRSPEGIGMLGLVWTLGVQWVFGSRLEGFWGTSRYLVMLLVAGVVGYGGTVALGLVLPAVREASLSGTAPLDAAALTAFMFVFGGESMTVFGREVAPRLMAGIGLALVLGLPLLSAVVGSQGVAGVAPGSAWPSLVPSLLAALVAALFVQPWRKSESSGKVDSSKQRGAPHLRVVRTADDMLN